MAAPLSCEIHRLGYLTTIRERKVTPGPEVKPGYMRELLPDSAPTDPEDWDCIFRDIEKVIMPGVVHWQSPYMHAYYPALTSWPSMLGDMLADAINNIGFTWASSPACTELEMNVMDWLCKALGLPTFFLHHHPDSTGGGILQSTVSESSLVALLAARKARIQQEKRTDPADRDLDDSVVNSRLVAYASDQVMMGWVRDPHTRTYHWQIPLSRRFRSLKLWFVMRSFGLKNLQGHIRHVCSLSLLESLVRCDPNFDMPAERHLGLVVFCLKEGNALTQELLRRLTRSGTMYLVPADIDRKRIIRFTVTSQLTTSEDIIRDWNIIRKMAADLLAEDRWQSSEVFYLFFFIIYHFFK
uniref:Histidine decarboxylase n=1 Tax=Salmo trutta TaxID=8032 RepID=A0A674ADG7_SALTR